MNRSITIYIEKSGDRREAFDISEYLQTFIKNQKLSFIGFKDGTMLDVTASWTGDSPLRVLFRHCRVVVNIYAKALYQRVLTILRNIAFSSR